MAYTNSSLATYTRISPHKTSPRNHVIDTITIHCIVGQWTAKQGCDYFATVDRDCSANYVVGKDGSIGLSVDEKDRSWCSSNASNDNRAITIEVASDTTHPYAVTDKALSALIELIADICKRNDIKELKWKADKSLIGQIDKQNMTVHRWFANKSCPGDYLYNKHSYIAEQVNKKLGVTDTTKPVAPTPSSPSAGLEFKNGDVVEFLGGTQYVSSNATSGSLIKASKAKITAISTRGKHPYHLRAINDNGVYIGGVYGWVDASTVSKIENNIVTEIVGGTKLTLNNVPLYVSASVSTKSATKSGVYYVWSNEVVNNRIRITNNASNAGKSGQVTGWISYADAKQSAGIGTSTTTMNSKKSLDDWAKEVILGKHGNGIANRTASLKKNGCPYTFDEVQKRVNELF